MTALLTSEGEQRRRDASRLWLEKCRRLVRYERILRASAKAQYDMLKGIDYSAVRVQSSPSPDAVPNIVIAHQSVARSLEQLADDAARRIAEVDGALYALDDPNESACLHLYYVDAMETWERVCVEMGYSYSRVMDFQRSGLLNLYPLLPHTERDPEYSAL